jgi:hypothetical protein
VRKERFSATGRKEKKFYQRRPDGNGDWIENQGDRRVLYRWPELIAHPDATAFITEGEKDSDRVASLGLCTTTVANGNWDGVDVSCLAGRDVIVLEDADKPGVKKAAAAAVVLRPLAKTLRIVRLSGHEITAEKHGKDVSDWLDEDPTRAAKFAEVCFDAPIWAPEPTNKANGTNGSIAVNAAEINEMSFDPIKYVVPGYIVEGLTLFAGKPKLGKSWLLLHAAIAVARGGYTLSDVHCNEGDVLYCALEDNLRRLRSRLEKLLQTQIGWPKRLNFNCEMPRLAEGGLDYIREWLEKAERPRLVVIDTLAMVRMPNRKDQTAYDADYACVKDLRALAHKYNVAIVLVHHLRKAEGDDVFDTISGTLGLTGCPDTIMVIRRDTGGTTLHARGRDLPDIEKAVTFNPETCVWTVLGNAGTIRQSDQRSQIVEALAEAGGTPLGPNQIAAVTGMKAANVRYLLGRMKADGIVRKVAHGKYELLPSQTHNAPHNQK